MGFRGAAVLAATSFFIGVQFICFNVDHRILYSPLTDEVVNDGFQFYTTFFNAPPAIKALLHALMGVAIASLLAKLHTWDETAMFFDGSSIAAYILTIAVYLTVTIPSLRTIVDPVAGVDTRDDQIEAMRVLSAGNTIMVILLAGVLLLQGGEEYARKLETKEVAKFYESQKKRVPKEKKDE